MYKKILTLIPIYNIIKSNLKFQKKDKEYTKA